MPNIAPETLGQAVNSILDNYITGVNAALDSAGERAITEMTQLTRASAPYSSSRHFRGRPHFKSSIVWRKEDAAAVSESSFTWYVKRPNYRLTHLLENPHATRSGGTVPGRRFVRSAYQQVISRYESDIADAVKG